MNKEFYQEMINALICMTGWTKAYAEERGWTPDNAALIWMGIVHADNVLNNVMGKGPHDI